MAGPTTSLQDAQVLVLEDDYYLACDLQDALEAAGATVLGPFSDAAEAQASLAGRPPDCAFVDVNLGEGPSYALPRTLSKLAVPFAFITGYDSRAIPEEFDGVDRFEKPVGARQVVQAATRLLRRD